MSSNGEVKSGKMFKVLDMVYIAIGAVLIVICSWINIKSKIQVLQMQIINLKEIRRLLIIVKN